MNVVIIFSGACKHCWNNSYNYYDSFKNHILEPLMKEYNIYIFIGCQENEKKDWENELTNKLPSNVISNIFILDELKSNMDCRFSTDLCLRHHHREGYLQQYGKLHYTYKKCLDYMKDIDFQYAIKLRFDLIYNSQDYFYCEWFKKLKKNTLMAPSTEFHCYDRWNERNPSMWPHAMCEQIIAGDKKMMDIYFNWFTCKELYNQNIKHQDTEHLLADYLILKKINLATFDLQYSRPGGHNFALGRNNYWLPKRVNDNELTYCKNIL